MVINLTCLWNNLQIQLKNVYIHLRCLWLHLIPKLTQFKWVDFSTFYHLTAVPKWFVLLFSSCSITDKDTGEQPTLGLESCLGKISEVVHPFFFFTNTCGVIIAVGMEMNKYWHLNSNSLITTANSAEKSSLVRDFSQQQINTGSKSITWKVLYSKHFLMTINELYSCHSQLILVTVVNIILKALNEPQHSFDYL